MIILSEKQLQTVKKLELQILAEIADICDKYGLKYYLMYGTLIGAVRHKGFIPWDDDIDIAMMRKDYEKLLEIAPAELGKEYFLVDYEHNANYGQSKCKVMIKGTIFEEYNSANTDADKGVFIDIFPLDNKPADERLQKKHQRVNYLTKKLLLLHHGYRYPSKGFKKIGYTIATLVGKILPRNFLVAKHKKNAVMYLNESSNLLVNLCGTYGYIKDSYPSEWFDDTMELSFEDRKFKVPKEYDKVLRHCYGDYMQLPPKEQQINKHGVVRIDLGEYEVEKEDL